MEMNNQKKELL